MTVFLSFIQIEITYQVEADIGENILDVAHDNDITMEGACGGECACSTCHVILSEKLFATLEEIDEEEEDMLDLAIGLTDTSRLGCQVTITEAFQDEIIHLPEDVLDY